MDTETLESLIALAAQAPSMEAGGGAVAIESLGLCHFKGNNSSYDQLITVRPTDAGKGASGGSIFLKCHQFSTENLTGRLFLNANAATGRCDDDHPTHTGSVEEVEFH